GLLILPGDPWGGRDDVAVAVSHQKVTVGDLHRSGISADEDVHSVVPLPQRPDLNFTKAGRLAQGMDHPFPDQAVQSLTLLALIPLVPLAFLFRGSGTSSGSGFRNVRRPRQMSAGWSGR